MTFYPSCQLSCNFIVLDLQFDEKISNYDISSSKSNNTCSIFWHSTLGNSTSHDLFLPFQLKFDLKSRAKLILMTTGKRLQDKIRVDNGWNLIHITQIPLKSSRGRNDPPPLESLILVLWKKQPHQTNEFLISWLFVQKFHWHHFFLMCKFVSHFR